MAKTILTVFAHPDDESIAYGAVALALEAGWRAAHICATRGEEGEIASPELATPENLGRVREQELRRALTVFNVDDVRFLGYRDSGMEGTPPNQDPRSFWQADPETVVGQLLAHFEDLRPDIVITFEPFGVYGHPDHIAICRYTTEAFRRARAAGLESRLMYAGMPPDYIKTVLTASQARGQTPLAMPETIINQAARFEKTITHLLDTRAFSAKILQSVRRHKTQMGPDSPFTLFNEENSEEVFGSVFLAQVDPLPWPEAGIQTRLE